jgi:hypothetical protein
MTKYDASQFMQVTDLKCRFGIEIETVGLSRRRLAEVIASVIPGSTVSNDPYHDSHSVTMIDGRKWNVVRDGSLSTDTSGEIVSPILNVADIDTLQEIVRAVRLAGARSDSSTGIHIHVDGARFEAKTVLNLVNMVHKQERLIERALGVSHHRLNSYSKSIDQAFISRLESTKVRTAAELNAAWYGSERSASRYDQSRYHGLNLNSFFYRGTIEFRYFNGTLHAGEVRAYVLFVLAIAEKALTKKSTSRARRVVDEADVRWAFRCFLVSLGLKGPEFKNLRTHLTKNLPVGARSESAA